MELKFSSVVSVAFVSSTVEVGSINEREGEYFLSFFCLEVIHRISIKEKAKMCDLYTVIFCIYTVGVLKYLYC